MELYQVVLVIATITTGLVAGLFFTFSMLIMPGLGTLADKDYVRAFQSIDKILQPNGPRVGTQPLFALVFFGAVIFLLISVIVGWGQAHSGGRLVLALAAFVYVGGMIVPTLAVNLPLNNKIQTYDTTRLSGAEAAQVRNDFEGTWRRWNTVRTTATMLTHSLLVVVVCLWQ